ncbi:SDR family NAD(P)-dependent oxidoreductase [Rhodoplanes sp. TEM]|uniref:SDR family NAD(P)-dependent oxidoreductase n=1 Tax=Rhodoplanes tepidamans TaxID=200616 RepID=A0ABT5JFU9_RHOTP|nr:MULTISPECIES: SDR family NAD(P)-dependent oxidoreductase [Rhodoplanes]MDC7788179.1 SDR family NAD(P)-dependent oxidoreductase [Rhodoplanes tepidamans]MDC7986512.1 SDR family NAD(P)-dependent oxidoreductase [Rhodoplanes sp. TEM]MDQ0355131.1 3-oxoacyl-[acyl-carrier protein] reductase [Rhodoplanes tepidamans]
MTVSYDFSGRRAVITGGARGLGRGVAERLRAAGATVEAWDVDPVPVEGIVPVGVDVTSAHQVAAATARAVAAGGIDMLVLAAGYGGTRRPVEAVTESEWRQVIDVTLTGVFQVCRAVVPHMRRAGRGRIVTVASLAAKEGRAGLAAFSAASAGIVAFTKALGRELADTPVRANCIAPAGIDTEFVRAMAPAVVEAMVARSPMKRLGDVAEFAELVAWLCSDACSYNSGAVFDLSGGQASF